MPELPEVETIRRALAPLLRGRRIDDVWVAPDAARLVQRMSAEAFAQGLRGRGIEDLQRRGKYLRFRLNDGSWWVVHLRMTGGLVYRRPGGPDDGYVRARFRLDNGDELRYRDLRKLGMMWHTSDPDDVTGPMGPEPLANDFTIRILRDRLGRRSAAVKSVLMDQRVIAGMGNIYADEALFAARIHPLAPANRLSGREVRRLHETIQQVLQTAIANMGTTRRDYRNAWGESGQHQDYLWVYGRAGEPCRVCGAAVERVKIGGRSSHYCPGCQGRGPRRRS